MLGRAAKVEKPAPEGDKKVQRKLRKREEASERSMENVPHVMTRSMARGNALPSATEQRERPAGARKAINKQSVAKQSKAAEPPKPSKKRVRISVGVQSGRLSISASKNSTTKKRKVELSEDSSEDSTDHEDLNEKKNLPTKPNRGPPARTVSSPQVSPFPPREVPPRAKQRPAASAKAVIFVGERREHPATAERPVPRSPQLEASGSQSLTTSAKRKRSLRIPSAMDSDKFTALTPERAAEIVTAEKAQVTSSEKQLASRINPATPFGPQRELREDSKDEENSADETEVVIGTSYTSLEAQRRAAAVLKRELSDESQSDADEVIQQPSKVEEQPAKGLKNKFTSSSVLRDSEEVNVEDQRQPDAGEGLHEPSRPQTRSPNDRKGKFVKLRVSTDSRESSIEDESYSDAADVLHEPPEVQQVTKEFNSKIIKSSNSTDSEEDANAVATAENSDSFESPRQLGPRYHLKNWEEIKNNLRKPLKNLADLKQIISSSSENVDWDFENFEYFLSQLTVDEVDEVFATLSKVQRLALQLPRLIPNGLSSKTLQERNLNMEMSKRLIACLLANGFFSTFSRTTSSTTIDMSRLNFARLFTSCYYEKSDGASQILAEKFKCLLAYFSQEAPSGDVFVECLKMDNDQCPPWEHQKTALSTANIKGQKLRQDDEVGALKVIFGGRNVGGSVFGCDVTQEEIEFLTKPELLIVRLCASSLGCNEAVLIRGIHCCCRCEGYGGTFKYVEACQVDAAPVIGFINSNVFKAASDVDSLLSQLNSLFVMFRHFAQKEKKPRVVISAIPRLARSEQIVRFLVVLMAAAQSKLEVMFYCSEKNLNKAIVLIWDEIRSGHVDVGIIFRALSTWIHIGKPSLVVFLQHHLAAIRKAKSGITQNTAGSPEN